MVKARKKISDEKIKSKKKTPKKIKKEKKIRKKTTNKRIRKKNGGPIIKKRRKWHQK